MTHRRWSDLTAGVVLLVAPGAHAQGEEPVASPVPTTSESRPDQESSVAEKAPPREATAKPVEAAPALTEPAGKAPEGLSVTVHGWTVGLYGFAALNVMHDSTQSFTTAAGNAILQRVGTFRGNNDQLQLTARDSTCRSPPAGSGCRATTPTSSRRTS